MPNQPIRGNIQTHTQLAPTGAESAAAELRTVMSHWPSGIAVLAVKQAGRIEAITLNSLISVSLEPPLVLVSIAANAPIAAALENAARYAISILAHDQARIASMVADRMPGLQSLFTDADEPVVKDSTANMICTTSQRHVAGDHILVVAQVDVARLGRDAPPLFYVHGRYRP